MSDFLEVRLHLNSGSIVELSLEDDEEPAEYAAAIAEAITEMGRPNWLLIDSTLFFTGAVSAIEVL